MTCRYITREYTLSTIKFPTLKLRFGVEVSLTYKTVTLGVDLVSQWSVKRNEETILSGTGTTGLRVLKESMNGQQRVKVTRTV